MWEMTVCPMELEDVPKVAALEREVCSQPWSEQGFSDALALGCAVFMVAKRQGALAGYCGMYVSYEEAEITNVAVDKKFRRQGVGKQMLACLLKTGERAGVEKVVLEVRVSNQGAIQLYKGMGFEPQGLRKDFYQDPREDGLVMARSQ